MREFIAGAEMRKKVQKGLAPIRGLCWWNLPAACECAYTHWVLTAATKPKIPSGLSLNF
jgi:hypothetical protein